MDLKGQISDAISAGKQDSGLELKWASEPHGVGKYSFKNEKSKKEIHGKFLLKNDKVVTLIHKKDYSPTYARKKIRAGFSKLNIRSNAISFAKDFSIDISTPRVGDEVLVKSALGTETQLDATRRYFALNSDFPDCNGDTLSQNFQVRFIAEIQQECASGANIGTYQKFSLIG